MDADSLARTEAAATLTLRWSDLRRGLATLRAEPAPTSSDGPWSCRLRLRYRVADHRAMLGELKLRMEARLDQFADAADSAEALATNGSFEGAVHGLSALYARGVSEWLVPYEDMSVIVARRLDRLLRRISIRFSSVRPEDCLYFVRVRTFDAAGRRLPAVPLAAKLPPGTGQVTPPSLPSNHSGEAVFLVQPSVTDSLPITVHVPRRELVDLISASPAARSALLAALGRYPARVQVKTVLDLHEQGKIGWHVGLVTRWSKRRNLFGSSAELVMLTGDAEINSASPFSRRVAVRCTRVVMGDEQWVPEGKGLLLASFRVSEAGTQIRRLSTTQLLEGVNDLVRRSKGGTLPPIRMCFALDLDAACSWTATRMEQWQVLPYYLP